MPRLENLRHEYFVREYVKQGGENATRAYLKTCAKYPGKPLVHTTSAAAVACTILKRKDVKARYNELLEQAMKRADITIDKILSDYQWAINQAKEDGKPDAVTAAATAQAKLVGLLRDRAEVGRPGDFDSMDSVSEILEKVAAEAGIEAASALAKAMGIEVAQEQEAAPGPFAGDLGAIEPQGSA